MKDKIPDRRAAAQRAKEIVRDLAIEEPSHIILEEIAFTRGAIVKEERMKGADGRLATLGGQGLITVREDIPEPGRKRFVIAHELGHYELHRETIPLTSCHEDDFLKWNTDNQQLEVEANHFAGELLMPQDMFKKCVAGKALSADLLESLYKTFSVSLTAAAIRFVTLRPEYALVCSSSDRMKWFVLDREWFPLYLNIKGKVHPESMAYEYFLGNSLPQKFCNIESEAWTDWKVRGKLSELAIPLGKHSEVLSFLHVEEEWDD
jgi:Zn-dependent peptidase ImmA (M78 family)